MNKKIVDKIREWLYKTQEQEIDSCETAFGNTFGTITMDDGRRAQIKVKLELDQDCWD